MHPQNLGTQTGRRLQEEVPTSADCPVITHRRDRTISVVTLLASFTLSQPSSFLNHSVLLKISFWTVPGQIGFTISVSVSRPGLILRLRFPPTSCPCSSTR